MSDRLENMIIAKNSPEKVSNVGDAAVIDATEAEAQDRFAPTHPGGVYELPSQLTSYFRNIGGETLLTAEEEVELAGQVKSGDESARQRMVRANLRLVVRIAREFEGMGVPLADLINEGNIGLMRAVDKFDPTKGAKFSTYSAFWIKHAIRMSLSNQARTVRVPVHMIDRIAKMRKVESRYVEAEGRMPSDEEVAHELELSVHQMRILRRAAMSQVSLDSPVEEGEDRSLGDRLADDSASKPWDDIESEVTSNLVENLMEDLREREIKILQHRFGFGGEEPMTLEEIGRVFGVTRERIRQIEAGALTKMRRRLKSMEKNSWRN